MASVSDPSQAAQLRFCGLVTQSATQVCGPATQWGHVVFAFGGHDTTSFYERGNTP